jgi:hypothetical protein
MSRDTQVRNLQAGRVMDGDICPEPPALRGRSLMHAHVERAGPALVARRWRQDESASSGLELRRTIDGVSRKAHVQPPCPEQLDGAPLHPDSMTMKEGGGHSAQPRGKIREVVAYAKGLIRVRALLDQADALTVVPIYVRQPPTSPARTRPRKMLVASRYSHGTSAARSRNAPSPRRARKNVPCVRSPNGPGNPGAEIRW